MRFIRSLNLTLGSCIKFTGIALLLIAIVFYIHFQARNLILGPTITLSGSYEPVQHERIIMLTGTARNIVKLTLNGREIHTDEQGAFTQPLVLENGYTVASLNARDRFGRTTSLTREYVYVTP